MFVRAAVLLPPMEIIAATSVVFPPHTVHSSKLCFRQRIGISNFHPDIVKTCCRGESARLGGNPSNRRSGLPASGMINESMSSENNSGSNAALQAGTRLSLKAHTKSQDHEAGKGNLSRSSGEEEEQMWAGSGREASGWELEESRVYFFAAAGAESLMIGGALLEEVLKDGLDAAKKAGRPRDVWLVMEPAFLRDHPGLVNLHRSLEKPTAAIVTTNGDWVLTTVKKLLPQAVLGKFRAPSPYVPNPFQSTLNPTGAVVGGGSVWH